MVRSVRINGKKVSDEFLVLREMMFDIYKSLKYMEFMIQKPDPTIIKYFKKSIGDFEERYNKMLENDKKYRVTKIH